MDRTSVHDAALSHSHSRLGSVGLVALTKVKAYRAACLECAGRRRS